MSTREGSAPEGRALQGWIQVSVYILVILASIVAGAAAAGVRINDLDKRQDAVEVNAKSDHDVLLRVDQQVKDLHEWLNPVGPWMRKQ